MSRNTDCFCRRTPRLKGEAIKEARYNFLDLSGIIFGAKASAVDKLKVIKVIEEKCRAEKRDDFEFYQAQYSRKTRSFRIVPLSLIRLRQGTSAAAEQQARASELAR
jgi:hypothetical protein